MAEKAFLYILR